RRCHAHRGDRGTAKAAPYARSPSVGVHSVTIGDMVRRLSRRSVSFRLSERRRVIPGVRFMAWFALARVLFVAAVAYAAAILEPFPFGVPANVVVALALAALVVFFESRLRETA